MALFLRGLKLVIPKPGRGDILKKIHEGHLGIEKSRKRGREVVFWPGISSDIKVMVENCPTCLKYGNKPSPEPLRPHEIPLRPWQRLASDLFTHRNKEYLVVVDYFSLYPEVIMLKSTTSKAVISCIKSIMARHGICDALITDNGPQYASQEFKQFTLDWGFKHITSSPYFPSSNGMAEAAVKTVKKLVIKSCDSGEDFYKGLLAYRSTPLPCGKSPTELLMKRRIKGTLPIPHFLLKSEGDEHMVTTKIEDRLRSKASYDQSARPLSVLLPKDEVLMQDMASSQYNRHATVQQEVAPRSYLVKTTDGAQYRRNRVHLKHISNPAVYSQYLTAGTPSEGFTNEESSNVTSNGESPPEMSSPVVVPRMSSRVIKPPARLIEAM